ncbi:MAG TPA: AI-2E family transporter [Terriglobales bacterium]|nr:AI-2E family transporter [Terriglobales bacterium]
MPEPASNLPRPVGPQMPNVPAAPAPNGAAAQPWTEQRFSSHVRTAGGALKNWFVATCQDALAVAAMWLVGLLMIGVPLAPLWAVLGGLFQFVPNIGPTLAIIGPAFTLLVTEVAAPDASDAGWMRFIYLLMVFAVIVVVDGLVLQPYLMKRTARVPIWASILAPIVLGFLFPFWGVLLAPPLLAVVYAFRAKARERT